MIRDDMFRLISEVSQISANEITDTASLRDGLYMETWCINKLVANIEDHFNIWINWAIWNRDVTTAGDVLKYLQLNHDIGDQQ